MDVTIDGQTYPTEGKYIFGPDMSENAACEQATINAKKNIISEVSPEILSAKTEMNCTTRSVVSTASTSVSKTEGGSSNLSTPAIQEGIPVITEKVIDSTPTSVVYLQHPNNKGFHLGGFTITFDPNRHKKGKCYANWETGGVDCY